MSVIIQGIDMPENCLECPCFNSEFVVCNVVGIDLSEYHTLHKNCPLVEIPAMDEWCTDCKEYDHERNCCPRFNRVIRSAMDMTTIFQNSKDMETIFKMEGAK